MPYISTLHKVGAPIKSLPPRHQHIVDQRKMTEQALGPKKLISIISSSAETIGSPLEAIAAFSHACMLAAGFRFLGFGEDHKAGTGMIYPPDDRTRIRRVKYPKVMDF